LTGQGDNEDPPSSEVISVKNGKERQGIASLDDSAPDSILLPGLPDAFRKANGGPSADGYVPSGTLWQRSCPEPKAEKVAFVPPPPADFAATRGLASSLWTHNGSKLYLVARGDTRRFYYDVPGPDDAEQGAIPGTLLFDGRKFGSSYEGTAYVFSTK